MTAPSPFVARFPDGHGLLEGKVAAVTAAAGSGIGSAIARRLAMEGALVAISDRHEGRLRATASDLEAETGRPVHATVCDVTEPESLERFADEVETAVGPIDVFVNNAGLGGERQLHQMTDDEWFRVIDVTLLSSFRGTRAALNRMLPRRRGTIVNVASVTGWRAEAGQCHYAAAKAGVMALTRCAAVEAAAHGVRVNAVAPTLATHPALVKVVPAEVLAHWAGVQPQRRAAETFEVASVVAFLASDLASYVTGEVVSVSAQHP